MINVLVLRRKNTVTKLTKRGKINLAAFHILELKEVSAVLIVLNLYISEIGWNRTNSDFSIDLQSTVLPLDYYLYTKSR